METLSKCAPTGGGAATSINNVDRWLVVFSARPIPEFISVSVALLPATFKIVAKVIVAPPEKDWDEAASVSRSTSAHSVGKAFFSSQPRTSSTIMVGARPALTNRKEMVANDTMIFQAERVGTI